jgi:hypothetical protein
VKPLVVQVGCWREDNRVVPPVKNKKYKTGRMRWEQVIKWKSSLAAGSRRPFNLNMEYGILT